MDLQYMMQLDERGFGAGSEYRRRRPAMTPERPQTDLCPRVRRDDDIEHASRTGGSDRAVAAAVDITRAGICDSVSPTIDLARRVVSDIANHANRSALPTAGNSASHCGVRRRFAA